MFLGPDLFLPSDVSHASLYQNEYFIFGGEIVGGKIGGYKFPPSQPPIFAINER